MKTIRMLPKFIKTYLMWLKIRWWLMVCKDKQKLMILNIMEDFALVCFRMIGWWIPEKKGGGVKL